MNELARQEMLQKPKYIIDCFSSIIAVLKTFTPFQSVSSLKEMYEMKKRQEKLLSFSKLVHCLKLNMPV